MAKCMTCDDTGTVCEDHPNLPWDGLSDSLFACLCGGAGMPCPYCTMPVPQDGAHSIAENFIPNRLLKQSDPRKWERAATPQ